MHKFTRGNAPIDMTRAKKKYASWVDWYCSPRAAIQIVRIVCQVPLRKAEGAH